jgi:hypothetical protein
VIKPISLRIRNAEVTARARQVLRDLNEKDRLRRSVKWQALKALVAVREIRADAVKLESADPRWLADVRLIETTLQKIVSKYNAR